MPEKRVRSTKSVPGSVEDDVRVARAAVIQDGSGENRVGGVEREGVIAADLSWPAGTSTRSDPDRAGKRFYHEF